jgi:hypothetical protein
MNAKIPFFIGGCALILFAACSPESLSGAEPTATWEDIVKTRVAQRNDQPTRTPKPTSTPLVRRTPTILATAGPTSTARPTSTPEATPTPNPMSAELDPVLLGIEDLPTGWRISGENLEMELTDTDNICGVSVQDPAVAERSGSYQASFTGPFAAQFLSLYDGSQNAAAVFEQLQTAYNACPSEGYDYGDGTWGYVSPISFPQIGEQSFGLRLGLGLDDFVIEIDMVIFRVDEVLATVIYEDTGALFGESSSPAVLEELVRKAETRIYTYAELIDNINIPIQTI